MKKTATKRLIMLAALAIVLLTLVLVFVLFSEKEKDRENVSFQRVNPTTTTQPAPTTAPEEAIRARETTPTPTATEADRAGRSELSKETVDAAAVMAEASALLLKGQSLPLADEDVPDVELGEMNDVAPHDISEQIQRQVQAIQNAIPEELNIEVQADTVAASRDLPLSAASEMGGFYETGEQLWVFAEVANIRQDASVDAEQMGIAVRGDYVWEVSTNGAWSYVIFQDGTAGYIYKDLLEAVEIEHEVEEVISLTDQELNNLTPLDALLYSKDSGVRIRREPSTDSEIIGELFYGDSVQCIAYGIDWYQVLLDTGEIGYIYGTLVQFEPVEQVNILDNVTDYVSDYSDFVDESDWYHEPEEQQYSAGGQALVDYALQFVGLPYRLGATGPDAFDCSGFVQFTHAHFGVSLGRTTYDQIYDGIAVNWNGSYSNLLPGDLILLAQGSDIYHVMIYIGNGQVVHAGTPATGVIVDNLDYYAPQIAYVRRIFY